MDSFLRTLVGPDGEVIKPCFRVDGDYMFVTLNGDVPLEREPPGYSGDGITVEWQGFYRDFDWAMAPDYLRAAQPYRPYMPVADRVFLVGNDRDWVFTWNAAMETTPYSPYRFVSREATHIRAATQEVWQWANQVAKAFPGAAVHQPPMPDLSPLVRIYKERIDFNAAVWQMRRAVLQCYGFVAQALLSEVDWRTKTWVGPFVGDIDTMGLLEGPKRGVFLGVTELSEDRLRPLIAHRVPVHYRWRFRPPLGREFFAYSPIAIGAFDFVSRQAQTRAAFERERASKRADERNERTARSEAGRPVQKAKKRWYKVTEEDPDKRIVISAAEGKRLSELYKVDNSKSTDSGDVAIILEGVAYDDSDDDDDTYMYLAPAPAVTAASAPKEAEPWKGLDATEWPALPSAAVPEGARSVDGEEDILMEVDDDCVSLGEEFDDGMAIDAVEGSSPASAERVAGVDELQTSPEAAPQQVAPALAQRVMGATETLSERNRAVEELPPQEQSPARDTPAFAQRMTGNASAGTSKRQPRGSTPPRAPRMDRERFQRDSGWAGARRLHDVNGGHRREDAEEARYHPYGARAHEVPRMRSPPPVVKLPRVVPRSVQAPPARPPKVAGAKARPPRTMATQPAAVTQPATAAAPPPQGDFIPFIGTAEEVAAMDPEAARRLLVTNLSAASAQRLFSVLVESSGGTVGELLSALSNPAGPSGSDGVKDNAISTTTPEAVPAEPVQDKRKAKPAASLEARLSDGQPAPTHTPLVARLGVSLEDRLSLSEQSGATLLTRLNDAPRAPQSAIEGTEIACSGWIRAMLSTEDRVVSDDGAFSKAPAMIAPPAIAPAAGLTVSWESRTELRVRRWLMERATSSVLSSVLKAFKLGCEFQIWTAAPPGWHPSTAATPHFRQLPRLPHKSGAKHWSAGALAQYQSNVTEVLARVHSRGALTAGSVLWRIALEWGPRWLVDNLLQQTDPTVGRVVYDAVHHRYAYALSHDEVDALLGVAVGSSSDGAPTLWPPMEMFHRSNWSHGQWNQKNESWFVQHAAEIMSLAPNVRAMARGKWRSQCRQRSVERQESSSEPGSAAEAAFLLREIAREYPLALEGSDIWTLDAWGT
ncbi:hypothetical protein C8R47DRAFT_1223157 [Mycena vitilis]|nr:hypothetical protein C8R47DRAFT_1223157 [Mycena vitilis]